MKFLKISLIISILYLMLSGFGLVNVLVSERYELDTLVIEESELTQNNKKIELAKIEERSIGIYNSKLNFEISIIVSLSLVVLLSIGIIKVKNEN